MPEALPIKKNDERFPSWLNFEELRARGLDHIARLSGDIWTDHNLHDPGITILEVLCYALTDLGYRTRLDIEELLALDRSKKQEEDNFFTAEQILTCNPLTILDYRKMLIDIEGVRNAWLVPAEQQEVDLYVNCLKDELQYDVMGPQEITCQDGKDEKKTISSENSKLRLNGLYKVYLELEQVLPQEKGNDSCQSSRSAVDDILAEVKHTLHQHRNLCEDYLNIIVLRDEQIGVCADVELKPDADPGAVLERIYEAIQDLLSPRLNYYSLQQMLERGRSTMEIFEGRPLVAGYSHGFVDTEELEKMELRRELHASDFYQAAMKAEGVLAVKKLYLFNYIGGVPQTEGEEWCLHLTENHRPVFAPELSVFNFSKGVLRLKADKKNAIRRFRKQLSDFQKAKLAPAELDLAVPLGRARNDLSSYYSIQHEFPLVYGIGDRELPDSASNARKAQALQMKGYLMFYDQLLAGYLAQLAHIRDLFSMSRDTERLAENRKTYFSNALETVPEIEKLVRFYQNGSSDEQFGRGQVVAVSQISYDGLAQRDIAIRQLVRDFQNLAISPGTEEQGGKFYFLILNQNGQSVLRSKDKYASEKEALNAAEALLFLGTLESSFIPVNIQEEHRYYFEFIYNPLDYLDYLGTITESAGFYYQRREQFLDHLLARFGEEFTEYVLLMFALNEGRKDPAEIIEDKASFLSRYDDISRNRGRAFNYMDPQRIWDTDNVSGMEERVAGLMGLDKWERRRLNNFDVVLREEQFTFQYLNHRGLALFEGTGSYPCEADAWAAYYRFLEMAKNKQSYQTYGCEQDSVYGFRIIGPDGKPYAVHPNTYGSAELRDQQMMCICEYFSEQDGLPPGAEGRNDGAYYSSLLPKPDGIILKLAPTEQGFYFFLYKDDGSEVYFKSTTTYATEQEACIAWHDFVTQAIKDTGGAAYADKDNEPNGRFSFGFTGTNEAGQAAELAHHPEHYTEKAKRDAKKAEVLALIQKKRLAYRIEQSPALFSWRLNNAGGQLLLQSYHRFKSPEQAAGAWFDFLNYGTNAGNFKDKKEKGQFRFQVLREQRLPLAVSGPFPNSGQREAAKQEAMQIIQESGGLPEIIHHIQAAHYYELQDDEGETLLLSAGRYANRQVARDQYEAFLPFACERKNYRILEEGGICRFGLSLVDQCGKTIAAAPELFDSKGQAELHASRIVSLFDGGAPPFASRPHSGGFGYQLKGQDGKLILSGIEYFQKQGEALEAFWQMIGWARDFGNYCRVDAPGRYGFFLQDDCQRRAAVHPHYYDEPQIRDQEMEAAYGLLASYSPTVQMTPHPGVFYFDIFEAGGKLVLHGEQTFPTRAEAQCAFYHFLDIASEAPNYASVQEPEGCCFTFVINGESGALLASHPGCYPEQDVQAVIGRIAGYILENKYRFQIRELPGTWHFELRWEGCSQNCEILLQGLSEFDEWVDARKDFLRFLDQFKIDPKFVEIEDPFTFGYTFSGEDGADHQAVHPFEFEHAAQRSQVMEDARRYLAYYLGISLAEDENGGEEGPQFASGPISIWRRCGTCEGDKTDELLSGFRLNKGDQPLARHPRNYHSMKERDAILAALYEQAKCETYTIEAICLSGDIAVKVKDKYYYQLVDQAGQGRVLWRSYKGYGTEAEAIAAFRSEWIYIIGLAAKTDNYRLPEVEGGWICLLDKEKVIAVVPKSFPGEAALQEARDFRLWHARHYPVIQEGKGKYRFRLYNRDNLSNDWISTNTYPTPEEALRVLDHFLNLLRYEGNYRKKDQCEAMIFGLELVEVLLESSRTYVDCLSYGLKMVHPRQYETSEDCEAAWKDLIQKGRDGFFGYLQDLQQEDVAFEGQDGKWYYEIRDPDDVSLVYWRSTQGFDDAAGAFAQFEKDREKIPALLSVKKHYRRRFRSGNCPCIEVVDYGPSDAIRVEACGEQCLIRPDCPKAWEELKSFLIHAPYDYSCYRFIDYEDSCRFGFRIVDNTYRVARHPRQYHSPEEREAARDWLFSKTNCGCGGTELLAEYCKKAGRYYYKLKIEGLEMYWMSYAGYDSLEAAQQAFADNRLRLIDYARELDYYGLQSEEGGSRIVLKTDEGTIIAISKALYTTPGEWNFSVEKRISHARSYPFFELDGRYGFQCYSTEPNPVGAPETPDTPDDCPPLGGELFAIKATGERIWESIYTYSTLDEAQCVYDVFTLKLKLEKSNYQRTQEDNCGPFGIEMTHPGQVLATHPQTYHRQQDREAAIQRTKDCLNIEGFHLVEHILLRPRQGASSSITIQFRVGSQECCFAEPSACYFANKSGMQRLLATQAEENTLIEGILGLAASFMDENPLPADTDAEAVKDQYLQSLEGSLLQQIPELNETIIALYLGEFIEMLNLGIVIAFGDRQATEQAIEARLNELIFCGGSTGFVLSQKGYLPMGSTSSMKGQLAERFKEAIGQETGSASFPGENAESSVKATFIANLRRRLVDEIRSIGSNMSGDKVNSLLRAVQLESVVAFGDAEETGQAAGRRFQTILSCTERESGRFLLYRDTYTNAEEAQQKKDNLIEGILDIIGELSKQPDETNLELLKTELRKRLARMDRGIAAKNLEAFVQALGLEELIQFGDLQATREAVSARLDEVILCFDRGAHEQPDALAPICADCCHAVDYIGSALTAEDCEGEGAAQAVEGLFYIPGADPYSFWATIVLPYWPRRFQNPNFRQFFEDTLRREVPAHIGLRICWLDPKQLKDFESNYKAWLSALSGQLDCNRQQAQDAFVKNLFTLSTVYPPGQLQASGCVEDAEGGNNFILLDQAQLA